MDGTVNDLTCFESLKNHIILICGREPSRVLRVLQT
jgi:hypothetical protein